VGVAFVVAGDRLEMIVEDQGSGIGLPPLDAEWAASGPLPEGGMGMAIIRAIVDELEVRDGADGHGTVVHMTKYLAAAAG
jgi:anti-sigma regulatory factor (Ser/Thr protein kinase)